RRTKRPSLHSCPRKPPPNDRLVISSSRRSERRTPLSQHAFSMVNINYARIRGRRGAGLLHVSGECLPWIQQEGDPAFFMSRATSMVQPLVVTIDSCACAKKKENTLLDLKEDAN
uniref:Uncharacterized protein n=1 Tax=Aegilops tauschii subsp. strangulata TaxID=200361 RepID=A0A453LXV0_AEGTS